MPLVERAKEYADRLLARSRKQIDASFKTKLEKVVVQNTQGGAVLPGGMLQGFIEALLDRIRQLGTAKTESLLTAYSDSGIPLDEDALGEIRQQVMAFTHSEQHRAIDSIDKMLPPAYGQFTAENSEYSTKQIYDGVTSIMEDLGFEIDIKRDKYALAAASQKRAYGAATGKRWDVFISHASEDKEEFVRPLAKALEQSGLEVWFDETALKVGDRLRESIDNGLLRSRFGVVVLSTHLSNFGNCRSIGPSLSPNRDIRSMNSFHSGSQSTSTLSCVMTWGTFTAKVSSFTAKLYGRNSQLKFAAPQNGGPHC